MLVLLLAAAFLPWGSSNICKTQYNMTLVQVNPVSRPKGEIVLTCSLTGVTSSGIIRYQWFVVKPPSTVSLIYTYEGKPQSDHIYPANAYIMKDVTYAFSETGLESRLSLFLNVTNKDTYRCHFQLQPGTACMETIPIQIQEPRVSLSLVPNYIQELDPTNFGTANTICSVDVSVGSLVFDVSYNGTQGTTFRILKKERKLQSFGYYQNGSYLTTLVIPRSGQIVCTVTDSLGTYSARKDIRDLVSPIPSSIASIVVCVIFVGFFIVALTIPIVIYLMRRRRTVAADIHSEHRKYHRMVPVKPPKRTIATALQTDYPRHANSDEAIPPSANYHPQVVHETKIFKRYFSSEWDWTKIEELSDNPVLYAGSGPSISDVQQGFDVDDNSWFLAALNSLCLAYEKGHWQEFHYIFGECKDLKGSEIPIKLWRYGEWKTIYVAPSLPTKDGKLCFIHSSNRNVFWSALLQKAYAQEYVTYRGLDGERDIHILEDLTGGVVRNYKNNDYQQESRTLYSALNCLNNSAIALTWKNMRAEKSVFVFKSVIEVNESRGMFSYRDFPPEDGGIALSFDRTIQFDDLVSAPDEYNLLYECTNTKSYAYITSFNGKWKHSQAGNYRNDIFWKNPQYLLRFNELTDDRGELVQICLAVMQKDTANKNITTEKLPWPLKMGLECFRITDETFRPMNALTRKLIGIRSDWKIKPRYTREVRGWWTIPINDRLIIVPTVEGGKMPADFLFRVFTDKPHITIVEELPPPSGSGEWPALFGI